jgi:flavin-dependent dehydrogenase
MSKKLKSVAIIGGGPAGATLGTLLARKGHQVAIFHSDIRPELIVGESLLPAIIPIIREVGIEDEVKKFSVFKPGASVWMDDEFENDAPFTMGKGKLPEYAYNTPRDQFDMAVLNAAEQAGVKIFRTIAKVEKGTPEKEVVLSDETITACGNYFNGQPDLLVDATGRTRLFARLLETTAKVGDRKDTALFAHVTEAHKISNGNINLHRMSKGWAWRIPLPGRISVGIVVDQNQLNEFGKTKEEQYDNFIAAEPLMKKFTEGSKRLTGVTKYTNYQLISDQMYGPGWAAAGDASGFLDPIFSTGLYLGMKSGRDLAYAIIENTEAALKQYQQTRFDDLRMWQKVINTWYSGRLFTLFYVGQDRMDTRLGHMIAPVMRTQLTRIFTGEAVATRYSRNFLQFVTGPLIDTMKKYGLHSRDVKDLQIN